MLKEKARRNIGAVTGALTAFACLRDGDRSWHKVVEILGGALSGQFGGIVPGVFELPPLPKGKPVPHRFSVGRNGLATLVTQVPKIQSLLRKEADLHAAKNQASQNPVSRARHAAAELIYRLSAGAVVGLPVGYASGLFARGDEPPIEESNRSTDSA